jgi:hypothetical protein
VHEMLLPVNHENPKTNVARQPTGSDQDDIHRSGPTKDTPRRPDRLA